jgi:hypothetical protein
VWGRRFLGRWPGIFVIRPGVGCCGDASAGFATIIHFGVRQLDCVLKLAARGKTEDWGQRISKWRLIGTAAVMLALSVAPAALAEPVDSPDYDKFLRDLKTVQGLFPVAPSPAQAVQLGTQVCEVIRTGVPLDNVINGTKRVLGFQTGDLIGGYRTSQFIGTAVKDLCPDQLGVINEYMSR